MDAKLFMQMLRDNSLADLRKMQYKYSKDAVAELMNLLKDSTFLTLPLRDFHGTNLVYLENIAQVSMNVTRISNGLLNRKPCTAKNSTLGLCNIKYIT